MQGKRVVRLKVLYVTALFDPEPSYIHGMAFCQALRGRGHSVEVLTGFPQYPFGQVYEGYRQVMHMQEEVQGVPVHRVASLPDHSSSGSKRALSYISLTCSMLISGLRHVSTPDVVFFVQGPAPLALVARWLAFRGIPYVVNVQDLWPESVTGSGMAPNAATKWAAKWFARAALSGATRIIAQSPNVQAAIVQRTRVDRVDVIFNWGPALDGSDGAVQTTVPSLPGRFNLLYAGNIGEAQDLLPILKAMAHLADSCPDTSFTLIGEGTQKHRLEEFSKRESLSNVHFLPRVDPGTAQETMRAADVLVLSLRSGVLARYGIPQKLQAYFEVGKPVLAVTNGEAADLVRDKGAGIHVSCRDPLVIAAAIQDLRNSPATRLQAMGRAGSRFYSEHMIFDRGMNQLEDVLIEAVGQPGAAGFGPTTPSPWA